jgi:hypothetical protein
MDMGVDEDEDKGVGEDEEEERDSEEDGEDDVKDVLLRDGVEERALEVRCVDEELWEELDGRKLPLETVELRVAVGAGGRGDVEGGGGGGGVVLV